MKYGIRKPAISKRVSARTTGKINRSIKKAVNPCYGKKGYGWINDPKKAFYNKVYTRTTVSVDDITKACNKSSKGVDDTIIGITNGIVFTIILIGIIASCVIASWIF